MVCKDEKDLSTLFVEERDIENQQKILEGLNEFLKIYPLLMAYDRILLYQDDVQKEYNKNTVFNGLSSACVSSLSLFMSEQLLNMDMSNTQEVVTIAAASFIGFLLLQRDNRQSYYEDSLEDIDRITEEAVDTVDDFYEIFQWLNGALRSYFDIPNNHNKGLDEVQINDKIKHLFMNNTDYIVSKIMDHRFEEDFGYSAINEAFNDVFELEGGFAEYISLESKRKVRKR